jgi:hypothetical protein
VEFENLKAAKKKQNELDKGVMQNMFSKGLYEEKKDFKTKIIHDKLPKFDK